MTHRVLRCPACGRDIEFDRYNARFGNQGYMYCDSDSAVLTWDSYDPTYSALSGDVHPWMLDADTKRSIEDAAAPCPNGGRFRFSALPRCPHCNSTLTSLAEDPTYYVVVGRLVDGSTHKIWR
jgi:hypothetical protein